MNDIEMKIWKLANYDVQNENASSRRKVKTILPLKATVKYRE
jgi:hypothetical protein